MAPSSSKRKAARAQCRCMHQKEYNSEDDPMMDADAIALKRQCLGQASAPRVNLCHERDEIDDDESHDNEDFVEYQPREEYNSEEDPMFSPTIIAFKRRLEGKTSPPPLQRSVESRRLAAATVPAVVSAATVSAPASAAATAATVAAAQPSEASVPAAASAAVPASGPSQRRATSVRPSARASDLYVTTTANRLLHDMPFNHCVERDPICAELLKDLMKIAPQKSPPGKDVAHMANRPWTGGFVYLIYANSPNELLVDARDMPWYTKQQKEHMKNAVERLHPNETYKAGLARQSFAEMAKSVGALCSKLRYQCDNRLEYTVDNMYIVTVDHAMGDCLKSTRFHVHLNEEFHLPIYQVTFSRSGSHQHFSLAQFVIQKSPVFRQEAAIDARRIFFIDGNSLNCKLDNLLVLAEHRMKKASKPSAEKQTAAATTTTTTTSKKKKKPKKEKFFIHNLDEVQGHPDRVWVRNLWRVHNATAAAAPFEACTRAMNRADLIQCCSTYDWSLTFQAHQFSWPENPLVGNCPSRVYSAILTAVKVLVVTDIILCVLGIPYKDLRTHQKYDRNGSLCCQALLAQPPAQAQAEPAQPQQHS